MNKLQVIDLMTVIKRTYPGFDTSTPSVDHYFKYLKDFPFDVASDNVDKHLMTERFPPTIADIRRRLGEFVESERSKDEAATFLAQLKEWEEQSTPPPEGYFERVRRMLKGENDAGA